MNNVQSNITIDIPAFTIPETKEQFDGLSIMQKMKLAQEHPRVYDSFAHPPEPKKPWE